MGNSVMNIKAVPNGKTGDTLSPEAVANTPVHISREGMTVGDTALHISLEAGAHHTTPLRNQTSMRLENPTREAGGA